MALTPEIKAQAAACQAWKERGWRSRYISSWLMMRFMFKKLSFILNNNKFWRQSLKTRIFLCRLEAGYIGKTLRVKYGFSLQSKHLFSYNKHIMLSLTRGGTSAQNSRIRLISWTTNIMSYILMEIWTLKLSWVLKKKWNFHKFLHTFGQKCAQSEDHFDSLVRMRTKATIVDFFASAAWV